MLARVQAEVTVEIARSPEDVFAYCYAMLYSPSFRSRYGALLTRDFPRVPLVSDEPMFRKLAALGHKLIDLHLLRTAGSSEPGYPVQEDNHVESPYWKGQRVYINAVQYFDPVPEAVWNYSIGGYQVAEKWLKDEGLV